MPVAKSHPTGADLEAFALGALNHPTLPAVEAHVADCPTCQERAAGVAGDPLVELLRRAHTRAPGQVDTLAEAEVQSPTPPPDDWVSLDPAAGVPAELARHERYRVLRLLGEGGMGSVYEAEHRVMQRPVALKVISHAYTDRPGAVERFRREVRAAARLVHPNIVTAYDAETAGATHFLVMEYVEGVSLARLVQERGPLPVAEACDCVRQAALGLQHAHERGMVHRDVKPANLIRCGDGTVKVLDFGLAVLTAERGDGLTEANVVMGTPDYMAPEQAEDPRTADIRADVYSLGCTLHFLLTGGAPYAEPTPLLKLLAHREQPVPSIRRARPDVPAALAGVLERLLAKKPANRYQTPGDVAAALEPFARPPATPPRKRRALLVAAVAFFSGLLLAAIVVYRIQTDTGELVITTESDDVKVVITQGGKLVDVIDTKTDKRITLALHSGEYQLELKGAPEGLKLSIDKATLTRGQQTLAKIERKAKGERIEKKPPEQVGEVRRFERPEGVVKDVAFSPDGRYVLSGLGHTHGEPRDRPAIRLWDVATGKGIRQFAKHTGWVQSVAFSPDGRRALSGDTDHTLQLWDVATGAEIRQFVGHLGWLNSVAFSPDGRQILSAGGEDRTARLWDANTGKEIHRFVGHTNQVFAVAFCPDGKRALSGSWDRTIRLWDVATGQLVRSFGAEQQGGVHSVACSPDGRYVLSGSFEETPLRLWDLDTGKQVRKFIGHERGCWTVAFSHDGRRALSGSDDATLRLWDVDTGKELHCFEGHAKVVWSVAFSPDDRYAVSGSLDRTLRLWRLPDPPTAKEKP